MYSICTVTATRYMAIFLKNLCPLTFFGRNIPLRNGKRTSFIVRKTLTKALKGNGGKDFTESSRFISWIQKHLFPKNLNLDS